MSTEKSTLMLFSSSLELVGGNNFKLGDEMVSTVSNVVDLGVTFESNLKFTTHINQICSKAKQRLYVLRKKILSIDPD